jgi:hypothetical protein
MYSYPCHLPHFMPHRSLAYTLPQMQVLIDTHSVFPYGPFLQWDIRSTPMSLGLFLASNTIGNKRHVFYQSRCGDSRLPTLQKHPNRSEKTGSRLP